jgi:hypothetical protein
MYSAKQISRNILTAAAWAGLIVVIVIWIYTRPQI